MILLLFYIVAAVLAVQDAHAILTAHADLDNSAVSLDNPPRRGLHRFSLALSVALYNTTAANNIADVIVTAKTDSIIAANTGKESQHLFNPLRGVGNKLICLRLLNPLDLLILLMLLILLI